MSSMPSPLRHSNFVTALKRLQATVVEKFEWAATFEKPKTSPNSLSPSTTLLSPYMKSGCLSPRLFYHKMSEAYEKNKNSSKVSCNELWSGDT